MDGGLDLDRIRLSVWTLMPDLGFVASRLFSCSSLASSKAVDYIISIILAWEHTTHVVRSLIPRFLLLSLL
jgi:hypothetical protein